MFSTVSPAELPCRLIVFPEAGEFDGINSAIYIVDLKKAGEIQ